MVAAVREQAEWGKLKDRIVTPERRLKYQQEHRDIVRALKARWTARCFAHLQTRGAICLIADGPARPP